METINISINIPQGTNITKEDLVNEIKKVLTNTSS